MFYVFQILLCGWGMFPHLYFLLSQLILLDFHIKTSYVPPLKKEKKKNPSSYELLTFIIDSQKLNLFCYNQIFAYFLLLSLKVCNLILFLKYLFFNHIINTRLFFFFKVNQELCNLISKHFLLLLTDILKIQILQIIKLLKIKMKKRGIMLALNNTLAYKFSFQLLIFMYSFLKSYFYFFPFSFFLTFPRIKYTLEVKISTKNYT